MATRKDKNDEDEGIVRRGWDTTKEKIAHAKEKTDEFVQENPWKSIGVAASVGALTAIGVAALFGRRKKSWFDSFRDMF
ncbi:MAG: hypothetical protein Q7S27_01320 [Nanoarchaeota archaeon]|nr:hypothetical protein [Nanoarchaeota archaeon]